MKQTPEQVMAEFEHKMDELRIEYTKRLKEAIFEADLQPENKKENEPN